MNSDNNPNEKPSFFDSNDESKSWPPSDNYETEEAVENTEDSGKESFLDSEDYLDQLIDNVDEKSNINNMRIIDDESDDDEYQDQAKEHVFEEAQEITNFEINSNKLEAEASYEEELDQDLVLESVAKETELNEAVSDDEDDFDLDDLIEADPEPVAQEASTEEPEIIIAPSFDNEESEFVLEEKPPLNELEGDELESEFNIEADEEEDINRDILATGLDIGTTGLAFTDPEGLTDNDTVIGDDFAESLADDAEFEDDADLKPFRTFKKVNLAEELVDEDEEESGLLAGVNRNVLIILLVLLLLLGYFLFNTFFNRSMERTGRSRRKPPKKERTVKVGEHSLVPVWDISSQKTVNASKDDKYAYSLIKFTGRPNPFAMPRSVLDALKRQADLELLAKKKPDTYKRKAYRATLVGVLTSEGSTVALVNMQEANFDVVEGTNKTKVLKLATKSISKAKKNTLEMIQGGFIGPWEINEVIAPEGAFSDAKIVVSYQGTEKVLSMGKAEDLGIFDPDGQLDDLEDTSNEFEEDDDSF